MLSGNGSSAGNQSSDGINWEERRRQALPTIELWKANVKALQDCGVDACQMRYALIDGQQSFVFTFDKKVPVGRIGLTFPATYPENLVGEGWKKLVLTLDASTEKEMFVEIRGRFERDAVPLDVKFEFLRTIRGGRGVGHDLISFTDTRTQEQVESTMEAVLDERLADGTHKYCRKDDTLRDMSVEGFVAILTRYLKDSAIRRRVLPK